MARHWLISSLCGGRKILSRPLVCAENDGTMKVEAMKIAFH
jgi:hypothetical protein